MEQWTEAIFHNQLCQSHRRNSELTYPCSNSPVVSPILWNERKENPTLKFVDSNFKIMFLKKIGNSSNFVIAKSVKIAYLGKIGHKRHLTYFCWYFWNHTVFFPDYHFILYCPLIQDLCSPLLWLWVLLLFFYANIWKGLGSKNSPKIMFTVVNFPIWSGCRKVWPPGCCCACSTTLVGSN